MRDRTRSGRDDLCLLDGLERVLLGIVPVADIALEDVVPGAGGRTLDLLGVVVDADDHERR